MNDNDFEEFLAAHLSEALDGQRGRAASGFAEHLKADPSQWMWPRRSVGRSLRRSRVRFLGLIGAGLAASIAALWAAPSALTPAPALRSGGRSGALARPTAAAVEPATALVERVVQTDSSDEGTFALDAQTPVRVLHQTVLRKTRWYDSQRRLQAEEVVPEENTLLVTLNTY